MPLEHKRCSEQIASLGWTGLKLEPMDFGAGGLTPRMGDAAGKVCPCTPILPTRGQVWGRTGGQGPPLHPQGQRAQGSLPHPAPQGDRCHQPREGAGAVCVPYAGAFPSSSTGIGGGGSGMGTAPGGAREAGASRSGGRRQGGIPGCLAAGFTLSGIAGNFATEKQFI